MSSAWKDWHLSKEGIVEPEASKLEELFKKDVKKILDVGCGSGRHTIYFARKGFEVYGFDEEDETLERAKQHLQSENLKADLRIWDMTKPLPYSDAFFDAVIAARVIHHTNISNILNIVGQIHRVLRPGGYLFLQVPSHESETFDSGTIWAEPGTLVARGGPERGVLHHFFKKDELLKILSDYLVMEMHSESDHYGGHCLIAQKKSGVDLWSFESQVYPEIDATGMRYADAKQSGDKTEEKKCRFVEAKFELGDGHTVAVKIGTLDEEPISNSRQVVARNLMFRVNFWKENEKEWYRVDSDNGFLHFHLETKDNTFKDHIKLPEDKTLAELVSYAFEEARKFLKAKGVRILNGEGFTGFA